PDRNGDFNLTPAQEARMRAVGRAKVQATDKLCFRYLKPVVNTTPLSRQAIAQAVVVLEQVRACMRTSGYHLGEPYVQNLSRGRAMFGFRSIGRRPASSKAMVRADHACEQRVQLAKKLSAIIRADRES